jgi:hypothetical protein
VANSFPGYSAVLKADDIPRILSVMDRFGNITY